MTSSRRAIFSPDTPAGPCSFNWLMPADTQSCLDSFDISRDSLIKTYRVVLLFVPLYSGLIKRLMSQALLAVIDNNKFGDEYDCFWRNVAGRGKVDRETHSR